MNKTRRVVLVTGAASGIGEAAARRFAGAADDVVLADVDGEGAERLARELRATGGSTTAVTCDQSSAEAVHDLFSAVVEHHGRLDVLFANAGWGRIDPFLSIREDDWRRHLDVNVTGTFLVCQAASRLMVESGRGGVITITSSSGAIRPAAQFAAYCSAKAALNMLTQVMAFELGPHDVRVNAVMPGVTETGMTKSLLDTGARELVNAETPLGRTGQPDDIADAVFWLSSIDASYITGTTLLVDGGGSLGQTWLTTDFRARGETNWKLRHKVYADALSDSAAVRAG